MTDLIPAMSDRAYRKYLQNFGRGNTFVNDFVDLYRQLAETLEGGALPDDALRRFRSAVRHMESIAENELSVIALAAKAPLVDSALQNLVLRGSASNMLWNRISENYSDMIRTVAAAEKDLFYSPRIRPSRNGVRWVALRNASPKEQKVERIRRDDPTLYQHMMKSDQQRAVINQRISLRITREGLIPAKAFIRGRTVMVGVDPQLIPDMVPVIRRSRVVNAEGVREWREQVTEMTRDEVLVNLSDRDVLRSLPAGVVSTYAEDGSVQDMSQFSADLKKQNAAINRLGKINAFVRKRGRGSQKYSYIDLDQVRKMPLEYFQSQFGVRPKPDAFVSLSDDPNKSTALTKIYPVKNFRGRQVITTGRFKGFFVDDLINAAGRLIEGSQTYYNPATGELDRREGYDEQGDFIVNPVTEPYITVTPEGKLLITVSAKKNNTDAQYIRDALDSLSSLIPSMKKVPGSRKTAFLMEPKDFDSVRDGIGALALSNTASKVLQAYFDKLAKAQRATEDANLVRYSSERLGLRTSLRRQQAQAVAWLDANGNKGICALDTGVGKTGTAIATMQNLRRNESLMSEGNGRFLFVCKGSLAGNIRKEIRKFIKGKETAQELDALVDVESYSKFSRRVIGTKRKPPSDPTFADDYAAIFFDEAHETLKNPRANAYKAVAKCKAKRKIFLTASPMVRSPAEVYTLSSLANGVDLNTREGRKDLRVFLKRYAEKVGGRVVGIKRVDRSRPRYDLWATTQRAEGKEVVPFRQWSGAPDVATTRDFNTWVKQNLFFADKRDVLDEEGRKLPPLNKVSPIAVNMDPQVEAMYKQTMGEVAVALDEVVKRNLRERVVSGDREKAYALAVDRAKVTLGPLLARLTQLSDTPNQVLPGTPNPKINEAKRILSLVPGRTLLFTDSPGMAADTYGELQEIPAKGVALGLAAQIRVSPVVGDEVRYTPRRYPDPNRPQPYGKGYLLETTGGRVSVKKNADIEVKGFALAKKSDWKVVVLRLVQNDPTIDSLVLTSTYATGQNLQSFSNVIHLDRDTWSNETMKQRSARAWRAGQNESVNEFTLDTVYTTPTADVDADLTLDKIRGIMQKMDDTLFNEVVIQAQGERLGEAWEGTKRERSLLHDVSRKMLERSLSPYASHLGDQE
jgi:hypothetical protein